ncbi:MAG: D-amino-acid dehydrogenase [Pseudoalteromonas tetraodonis]|jgi:D-amino-acid dehydrogenase
MSQQREVIVVGGGVIGLSIAHYLARDGHAVRVIERAPSLERSCSEGNAGMIVPSHFIPLAAPGVITQGLKWMLNPKSPFSLKPRLDFALARWIWLFWRHSTNRHVHNSETLLRDLSLESRRLHVELSEQGNFPLVQRGLLMLCQTQHGLDDEVEVAEAAHRLGLEAEVFDRKRLHELEPDTEINAIGGVWFPQDCHLAPDDFISALKSSISANGGEFIQAEASTLLQDSGRVRGIATADGEKFEAATTILAGGIETSTLARQASLDLPMQGGKGYSLTLPDPAHNPQICSLLKEGRVAVTPMGDQLRVAGTMEICGSDTSIAKSRLAGIIESFCRFYPQYDPADFQGLKPWVGLRPCSPDGLPYIGEVPNHEGLIIATGHSMMGLSLAPVTGRLVAQLVTGETPSIDISKLAPGRFG